MSTYELIYYFDVWEDPDNTWIINNQMPVGEISFSDDTSDDDLLALMVEQNMVPENKVKDLAVAEYGSTIEIVDKKDSYPYYGLVWESTMC